MINSFSGDSERCVLECNLLHGLWAWFTFSSYVDASVLNINEFRNNPVSFSSFSSAWVLLIRTELSASNTEDGAEAWKPIRLLPSKIYYVKEESRVTASTWISFLKLIGSLHPSGWIVQSDRSAEAPERVQGSNNWYQVSPQRQAAILSSGFWSAALLLWGENIQYSCVTGEVWLLRCAGHVLYRADRPSVTFQCWLAKKRVLLSLPFCSSLAFSCLSKLFAHFWAVLQQTERQRDIKRSDRKVSRNPGEKSQTNLILLRQNVFLETLRTKSKLL